MRYPKIVQGEPNTPFRPTEVQLEMFDASVCGRCRKASYGCWILQSAWRGDFQKEWRIDDGGWARCTAFEGRG